MSTTEEISSIIKNSLKLSTTCEVASVLEEESNDTIGSNVTQNSDQGLGTAKTNEGEVPNGNIKDDTEEKQKLTESVSKAELTANKRSRELKLLLELSKEANLDTNIQHKRKSVDPATAAEQRGLSSPGARDPKRLMRPQNPVLVVKQPSILSKVEHGNGCSPLSHSEEKNEKYDKVQKRKSETSPDVLVDGAVDVKARKLSEVAMNPVQHNKDSFCWRCHRDDVNISCETCPRSFHYKCLRHTATNADHWICPECISILTAECTVTRSQALKDMSLSHLCGLLKFAHKRMVQCNDSEPFLHEVNETEFPDYKQYIVQPMDLTRLEKNIKDNIYGSTNAFEADARWILHNSIIYNSYQSKLTTVAKNLIKVCKQEMNEIENCPTCYLNANTKKEWFVEVCPKPHLLVWAKLKGFPYWPAKVMSTNTQGMVDVRFFGAHDKAWVPFKECLLFTKKDPNSGNQKRNEINECIKELEAYVKKLEEKYGEVKYPPHRTPFDPDCEFKQLQKFLPGYKTAAKPVSANQNISKRYADSCSEEEDDGDIISFVKNAQSEKSSTPSPMRGRQRRKSASASRDKLYNPASANKRIARRSSLFNNTIDKSLDSNLPISTNEMLDMKNKSVEVEVENKELTLIPTGNLKITDKLMRKLSGDLEVNDKSSNVEHKETETKKSAEVTEIDSSSSILKIDSQEINELKDYAPTVDDIKQVILGNITPSENKESPKDKENKEEPASTSKNSNKENKDINNTSKKVENADPPVIDINDDLLVEMYSEIVDEHQLNGTKKPERTVKRKRPESPLELCSPIQKKLIKLVDIDVIKNLTPDLDNNTIVNKKSSDPSISKTDSKIIDVEIKNEPVWEVESDSQIEAKRVLLSALNISEKSPPALIVEDNQNSAKIVKPNSQKLLPVKSIQRARKTFPKRFSNPINPKLTSVAKQNLQKPKSNPTIPTTTQLTPVMRQIAHVPRNVIPITRQVTPVTRLVTPAARQATPVANNVAPATIHATPAISCPPVLSQNFTVTNQVTSVVSQVTSVTSELASATSQGTSVTNQVTSVTCQVTAVTTQVTSVTSQVTSVTNSIASVTSMKNNSVDSTGVVFLTQPNSIVGNLAVLPPNQTIAYTGNITNPVFTMVQHPTTFANYLVPTSSLNLSGVSLMTANKSSIDVESQKSLSSVLTNTTTSKPVQTNSMTIKPIQTSSMNLKPIQTAISRPGQANTITTNLVQTNMTTTKAPQLNAAGLKPVQITLSNAQTGATSQQVTIKRTIQPITTNIMMPSLCNISTTSSTITVPPALTATSYLSNLLNNTTAAQNNSSVKTTNSTMHDNEYISERLGKALAEIAYPPPPILRPKPPGPLSTDFGPGVPSSAGPVTSRVNLVAHKLTDYMRGMFTELLTEFGTAENPEATITILKLENERLKQTHLHEVAEMKKNLQTILKELQKNFAEERQRIVEETRVACELETIRRVEEAKSKQWCANCVKEAQFYCCWNTSYCDYPCQVEHWPSHMDKCSQTALRSENNTSSPKPMNIKKYGTAKSGTTVLIKSPKVGSSSNKPVETNKSKLVSKNISCVTKPQNSNNTITIVEQTPGNFEVLGNGPISVGGKLFSVNTSVVTTGGQKLILHPVKQATVTAMSEKDPK